VLHPGNTTSSVHRDDRIVANHIAREVLLELARQLFSTHLIVLDGQGIDVILGMSQMKLHKAILDIAK
jgi:hypothetical protein